MEEHDEYEDDDGGACPYCGGIIYAAAAWSVEEGGELIEGILCPHCGEFVADDELDYEYED